MLRVQMVGVIFFGLLHLTILADENDIKTYIARSIIST
jgi:hypothetical protein